jgi:hypothetical protein
LAGPRISELGRVESRRSPGGVDNIVRDQDQRFKVKDEGGGRVGGGGGVGGGVRVVAKMSKLREEK